MTENVAIIFVKTNGIRRWGRTRGRKPRRKGRGVQKRAASGSSKREGTRETGETEGNN